MLMNVPRIVLFQFLFYNSMELELTLTQMINKWRTKYYKLRQVDIYFVLSIIVLVILK